MGQQKHLRGSSRIQTTAPTRDMMSSRGMAMNTSSHCHHAPPFARGFSSFSSLPSAGFSSPGLPAPAAVLGVSVPPNLSACSVAKCFHTGSSDFHGHEDVSLGIHRKATILASVALALFGLRISSFIMHCPMRR